MADIALRHAQREDLPAVLALYAQPAFNGGCIVTLADAERLLARFAAYPDYGLYVAEENGAIVGTIALLVIDNIAHWGTPPALIESVVVDERHQGRGIGRAMMVEAMALAASKGCYKASLSTSSADPAVHAFYESLGFSRHGISYRLDFKENAA